MLGPHLEVDAVYIGEALKRAFLHFLPRQPSGSADRRGDKMLSQRLSPHLSGVCLKLHLRRWQQEMKYRPLPEFGIVMESNNDFHLPYMTFLAMAPTGTLKFVLISSTVLDSTMLTWRDRKLRVLARKYRRLKYNKRITVPAARSVTRHARRAKCG